jgi:hypothetical protein
MAAWADGRLLEAEHHLDGEPDEVLDRTTALALELLSGAMAGRGKMS